MTMLQVALPQAEIIPYVFNEKSGKISPVNGENRQLGGPRPELGPLLLLGDLGKLGPVLSPARKMWNRLGEKFIKAEQATVVVYPGFLSDLSDKEQRIWSAISWEMRSGSRRTDQNWQQALEKLVKLASPAIRVEVGLLRLLRTSFFPQSGVGLEIAFWQHDALSGRSLDAASFSKTAAKYYRNRFARLDQREQCRAFECIRLWRHRLPDEIYFEELLGLPEKTKAVLSEKDQNYGSDLETARSFFEHMATTATDQSGENGRRQRAWLSGVSDRISSHALECETSLRNAITSVRRIYDPGWIPPVAPAKIVRSDVDVGHVHLRLGEQGFVVDASMDNPDQEPGSPLITLPSRNGVVDLSDWRAAEMFPADQFWEAGIAPNWADDWGVDAFGAWATISVIGHNLETSEDGLTLSNEVRRVTQKLRWIPQGQFVMGSPEDEPGRYDDEGPRHERTIEHGFWLFDTPVTQALWGAVMEANPSEFLHPDRPVDSVSFEDVLAFITRLNEHLPGLNLGLPSEAEWEYACRGGTKTATYAGQMEILGAHNAPILDEIAWYAGNSGRGYDLAEGFDTSDWSEKQYPEDQKAGTRIVGLKHPNAFGLYDMLGNVWEWCLDEWHDTYEGAPSDGSAREGDASRHDREGREDRVIRGGSWYDLARDVRAAYRNGFEPSYRYDDLGFRCAGGRVEPGKPVARSARVSAEPGKPRSVTRERSRVEQGAAQTGGLSGGDTTMRSGAVVDPSKPQAIIPLENGVPNRRMQIRTDKAVLTLEPMTKPDWAHAIGRDRFGLYADFKIETVRQRLRWIPPGQFMMGTPEDKPGRFNSEGPQHEVTIAQGFWLFDTPVTQDLWDVLMGQNPSRFQHPRRPVEQVDWKMARDFATALTAQIPDLSFELPSEAEWEYACRGWTQTATYAGQMEILGERNAPILDEIAWYGGNSGRGYDLAEGFDTSGWDEKQYPEDQKAGTRIVGLKRPNAFGLYDMLGNVWEWCLDEWHGTYEGAPSDGSAWQGDGSSHDSEGRVRRVIRGGSWDDYAQGVRAAFRYWIEPSGRDFNLGFRCAGRSVELRQAARSAGGGLAGDARAEPRGSGQTSTERAEGSIRGRIKRPFPKHRR
ncbi:formylglycine-generating enzyme family protein [Roseibium sediminis]|uniref:formylglycine-generating enzyme family protein n=1 Tax=Roseibium sediminis TaxID=1775174 RepID=UPI00123D124A|nr:formylglycine-generating enzyme family protein [Roseibium sediminis]